jgi:hypothetical protein
MTAEQPANLPVVDRFETMLAASPPPEETEESSVVAPIVAEYEAAHLGNLREEVIRPEVMLPQEWKVGMSASGYQSEQAARREFLNSLTAAAKKEECPECDGQLDSDGLCEDCGYQAMTAAKKPKIEIGTAVSTEPLVDISTAESYSEHGGKKDPTKKQREKRHSLTAAALAPVHPPREWFETPEVDGPFPLTITADGRIMGHVAVWNSCHTGFPGRCTRPPTSPSGYSYFHTGALELEDGSSIPVGRLTFNTGHASLTASRAQAAAHYDNTGKVGAFVRAVDGKHGIWVCGAVRSDMTEPELQTLRASAPSGDWRRPKPGQPMEMIGLLSVNVAGFPVPRGEALVAGAGANDDEEVLAMVAAGFEDTIQMTEDFYAKRIEVLAMISDGSLADSMLTPLERRMAMTAAYTPGRERYGIVTDEDAARQLAVLADMAEGQLERSFMSPSERLQAAIPQVEVATTPDPSPVIVNVTVNTGEAQEAADDDLGDPHLDEEVALQIDFLRDHGYWPSSPLSETDMGAEDWERVQTIAPLMVESPDLPMSIAVRDRLVRKGLLYS